jgi:hypothetical protein
VSNGDGRQDLVTADHGGCDRFVAKAYVAPSDFPCAVSVVDFANDAMEDVATADRGSQRPADGGEGGIRTPEPG